MKVYVLQMCSTPNIDENLLFVEQQLNQLHPKLSNAVVVLPECFAAFGGSQSINLEIAEPLGSGPVQTKLAELALTFQIYLIAGTFPLSGNAEQNSITPTKVKPTTLVYSPQGELITHYQKIHLFDVDVEDGVGRYRESDSWEAGEQLVCFDTEGGRIGLAICYDLRFPGLFQALRDKEVDAIVLPSAFTETTGAAHWQVLLQARAIENQVYLIGCNQAGTHQDGRKTFGNSMVVDPWGRVLFNAEKQLGLFGATVNLEEIAKIRQSMPIKQHNKFVSQKIN